MRQLCVLVLIATATLQAQSGIDKRQQTLDELLKMLHPSRTPADGRINAFDKTWEDWLKRTGELPPDFDSMPSIPDLPDPLVLHDTGRDIPVTTSEQWSRQRAWLRNQMSRA